MFNNDDDLVILLIGAVSMMLIFGYGGVL